MPRGSTVQERPGAAAAAAVAGEEEGSEETPEQEEAVTLEVLGGVVDFTLVV